MSPAEAWVSSGLLWRQGLWLQQTWELWCSGVSPFEGSHHYHQGFPRGSEDKVSTCNARDPALIPGLGRSPGEENDNPLQQSCLENSMDGEGWLATVYGVTKSRT